MIARRQLFILCLNYQIQNPIVGLTVLMVNQKEKSVLTKQLVVMMAQIIEDRLEKRIKKVSYDKKIRGKEE
ncbi:hypothetical protein [Halobacillus seohaensis]|uniref:Uncharacterized protein n=1 Tax=Halobacillus seohaensis TaxID=447421 RepID=A0ABW2ELG2_9BACI